jgi:hypothetical protein
LVLYSYSKMTPGIMNKIPHHFSFPFKNFNLHCYCCDSSKRVNIEVLLNILSSNN